MQSLPFYELKTRAGTGKREEVFCPIRKKWVALTPEEHVRQCLVQHLLELNFPKGLLAVERAFQYNSLSKRFDALIFRRDGEPFLLAECKAPFEPLDEAVVDQALRYNSQFHARWLLFTNGTRLFTFEEVDLEYHLREQLPSPVCLY